MIYVKNYMMLTVWKCIEEVLLTNELSKMLKLSKTEWEKLKIHKEKIIYLWICNDLVSSFLSVTVWQCLTLKIEIDESAHFCTTFHNKAETTDRKIADVTAANWMNEVTETEL